MPLIQFYASDKDFITYKNLDETRQKEIKEAVRNTFKKMLKN